MLTDEKVAALRSFLDAQIKRADDASLMAHAHNTHGDLSDISFNGQRRGLQMTLGHLNALDTEPGMALERRYNPKPLVVEL